MWAGRIFPLSLCGMYRGGGSGGRFCKVPMFSAVVNKNKADQDIHALFVWEKRENLTKQEEKRVFFFCCPQLNKNRTVQVRLLSAAPTCKNSHTLNLTFTVLRVKARRAISNCCAPVKHKGGGGGGKWKNDYLLARRIDPPTRGAPERQEETNFPLFCDGISSTQLLTCALSLLREQEIYEGNIGRCTTCCWSLYTSHMRREEEEAEHFVLDVFRVFGIKEATHAHVPDSVSLRLPQGRFDMFPQCLHSTSLFVSGSGSSERSELKECEMKNSKWDIAVRDGRCPRIRGWSVIAPSKDQLTPRSLFRHLDCCQGKGFNRSHGGLLFLEPQL